MFTINSIARLTAAAATSNKTKKKEDLTKVKDLSDSSLSRIANDDSDPRSHDAFTEIMRRKEKQEEAEKRSNAKKSLEDKKKSLLDNKKSKSSTKVKKEPFRLKNPVKPVVDKLDSKEGQDVTNIGIELTKVLL